MSTMAEQTSVDQQIQVRYSALAAEQCCRRDLSCGRPLAHIRIETGWRILDLGCGAGTEILKAAEKTGPEGYGFGIDLTPAMLRLGRQRAKALDIRNIAFIVGRIDAVPVPDAGIDLILSNCAINHVSDKAAVFREIYRLLRPSGIFVISDIFATKDLPAAIRDSTRADCLGGAVPAEQYFHAVASAGFRHVTILEQGAPYKKRGVEIYSMTLRGHKDMSA